MGNVDRTFQEWIEVRGPSTPLADMIGSFISDRRLSEASAKDYERVLRSFVKWAGNITTGELSAEAVNGFLATKRGHRFAARNACAYLKSFASWLSDERYLPGPSVLARMKMPRVPTEGRLPLDDTEIEAIQRVLAAKPNRTRFRDTALFFLLFSSGVRRAEACGLLLEDVVMDIGQRKGFLEVRAITSKGMTYRRIRLGRMAVDALHKYIEDGRVPFKGSGREPLFTTEAGKAFKPGGFQSWLSRLSDEFEEAGIRDWKAHRMRTTWATWFHRGSDVSGATVYDLKREGGWKDLSTPLRYTKDRPWEELAAMPTPIEAVMMRRRVV